MLKKSNGLDNHCFGIVVSKKIHKSAVKRNRLRRQLYEAIRILEKDAVVPNPPPSDIVLLARGPLLEMDFSEIMRAVRELFTPSNV